MDEITSFDTSQRQTINPLVDEINKQTEPLLKAAMNEFGFQLPLSFRLYNQIRFYEVYGKLKMGTSVASKKTLAEQFDVTEKQIDNAFDNLTNKYKLGKWVTHDQPVFRNVSRTWMSNERLKTNEKYYSVIPEVLQRNTTSITAEYLASGVRPLSETKVKLSESKNAPIVALTDVAKPTTYGNQDINDLLSYWQSVTGLPIQSKVKLQRQACSSLIKQWQVAGVQRLIDGVALSYSDQYAPRISDFADLRNKQNDLLVWGRKKELKTNSRKTIKIWNTNLPITKATY